MNFTRWAGPVAGAGFAGLTVVLGLTLPGYDEASQYLSELGARGAPRAVWMNYAGIVPFGLLMALHAAGWLGRAHRWTGIAGAVMLLLAGAGFALAGVQPCDAGCSFRDMSRSAVIHNLAAFGAFVTAQLAVTASLADTLRRRGRLRLLLDASCAVVMAAGFGAMLLAGPEAEMVGALQRVFVYGLCAWLVVSGMDRAAWAEPDGESGVIRSGG